MSELLPINILAKYTEMSSSLRAYISVFSHNLYFHFDRVKSLWRELGDCLLSFLTVTVIFSRIFFNLFSESSQLRSEVNTRTLRTLMCSWECSVLGKFRVL